MAVHCVPPVWSLVTGIVGYDGGCLAGYCPTPPPHPNTFICPGGTVSCYSGGGTLVQCYSPSCPVGVECLSPPHPTFRDCHFVAEDFDLDGNCNFSIQCQEPGCSLGYTFDPTSGYCCDRSPACPPGQCYCATVGDCVDCSTGQQCPGVAANTWDPLACTWSAIPPDCGPFAYFDWATCSCIPCSFSECWCDTELRCVTCDDPPCKVERGCDWDVFACDWDCITPTCSAGEHYDLVKCACVTDCPPGQCWCNGTASCMDCPPPDCAAELKCAWDVDLCDYACQPPPCVAPATWTGAPACTCTGGEKGPANLLLAYPNYHAASDEKGILYQRAEDNIPPFAANVQVTTNPAHTQPRMCRDWRHRTLLLYTDNGSGTPRVVERVSDDDGNTWTHPRTIFLAAKHSIPAGPQPFSGCVVYAAFDTATNTIIATRRYPGDTADSDPFTFSDSTGTPIVVDDTNSGLREAKDGPGRWLWFPIIGGVRKHFESTDDCETWLDVT